VAQKRKKSAVKKPLPSSKPGKVEPKKAPSARKKPVKKNVQTGKLIQKAAKKIKSRVSRHSDEWLKNQTVKPQPVPKKTSNKPVKAKRKLPPIKYRNKIIPAELAEKIRLFRAEAVKRGKFYTNKYVLSVYYKMEKELMEGKKITDNDDPLNMKKKVTEGISTRQYELRGVVNALIDIRNDVGQFTIAILGFGESGISRFNNFGTGLRKVDQELGYIYEAFNIYEMKYGLNSPLFSIILVWDPAAKIAFIDFNKTIFQSVDPDIMISIIIQIKMNMGSDVVSQLSDEQLLEIEKSESEMPAKKRVTDGKKKKKPVKKKAAKKKPVKKSTGKKGAVKKATAKKSKKKKIIYPTNKQGNLDMRYKQNRDLSARREKARKTREKNKRAAAKAERERIKRNAVIQAKRAATIAKNKRKKKK
jgi:hypothetical protein